MELLRGIIDIALGRARGLMRFGATPRAFITSVVVLMAVPAISSLLVALRKGAGTAFGVLLLLICALLAPAVISHLLARLWDREALWLRFATVYNWSRFAVVAAFVLMLAVTAMLIALGLSPDDAGQIMLIVVSFYSLWLEWFIARNALQLSATRALAMVLAMNFGTFVLLAIPSIAFRLLNGDAGLD